MRHAHHHRQERLSQPVPTTTLHVAALPFPTPQGTQAVLGAMLAALTRAGRDPHLLVYPRAAERDTPRTEAASAHEASYPVHRARGWLPQRSLRSGPSAGKLVADVALGIALARARRQLNPQLIVAHHVEAAWLAGKGPGRLFFAHTDLAGELPFYAAPRLESALARAGHFIDRTLVQRAGAVAAISPALTERVRALAGERGPEVHYVPPPWPLPAPISQAEREQARAELGLRSTTRVLVYAGNLDRYQGWEALIDALRLLCRRAADLVLLVGTQSDPAPLRASASDHGVAEHVRVASIADEPSRRRLHAAADLAVVPRRAPGGLPIKLLDALARGVPCVVGRTARAGLSLEDAAWVASGDDGAALAAAISALLESPSHSEALAHASRGYVARAHGDAAFLQAFDRVCAAALRAR